MNTNEKRDWSSIDSEMKRRYEALRDSDLTFTENMDTKILERIEKKIGKTRDEIMDELRSITNTSH